MPEYYDPQKNYTDRDSPDYNPNWERLRYRSETDEQYKARIKSLDAIEFKYKIGRHSR